MSLPLAFVNKSDKLFSTLYSSKLTVSRALLSVRVGRLLVVPSSAAASLLAVWRLLLRPLLLAAVRCLLLSVGIWLLLLRVRIATLLSVRVSSLLVVPIAAALLPIGSLLVIVVPAVLQEYKRQKSANAFLLNQTGHCGLA
jgi:hypothetical protein